MALWTPSSITTALWLDAADSDTIAIATGVSQWADKSGNARHAAQSGSTAQPALMSEEVNGLAAIRFDGVNDLLTSTQSIDIQSAQTFVVGKTLSGSARYVQRRVATPGDSRYYVAFAYSVGGTNINTSITGDLAIHCVRSLSGQQATWTNGVSQGTASDANAHTHTTFPIGGGTDHQSTYGNVDVCEVIHFDTPADDTTREKIEGYLAHKWGLQAKLTATHPYIMAAPTNYEFQYDPYLFSAEEIANIPTNLRTSDVTATTARLEWDAPL